MQSTSSLSRKPHFISSSQHCSHVQGLPHCRRPAFRRHTKLLAHSSGSDGSESDAVGSISEEEAEQIVRRLQRCNSIQQGYLDRQKGLQGKECCWGASDLPRHHTSRRGVSNQVQLSTYPDCIGSDLTDLRDFLDTHIDGAIGSVHLLPIYPSTGDRGFAPVTYQEVDPKFGNWNTVRGLTSDYQLCLEYMVNHISPASPQFQDYLQHGEASPYSDMFVKWSNIWPGGKPTAEQLGRVRTRKPAPPVLEVHLADGSVVPLWVTFSDQQVGFRGTKEECSGGKIDINPFSEEGWRFTVESLRSLCKNGGAKLIRLDAFGYVTKKAGTNCFMEEPEMWELLERIRAVMKPFGVQLLCEVHEDFNLNIELARHGFWVYDFALPMLMLHALRFKTAESLKHWLSICPRRQITTLDTHDGMGVDDVAGLAPLVDVREVEQCILGLGGTVNYKHFYEPHAPDNCDRHNHYSDREGGEGCQECSMSSRKSLEAVKDYLQPDCMQGCYTSVQHQYNTTYFSATKEDPQVYLMARAVQFFTPGVPMVYYVGLLAGSNDYEELERGSIRDINRHYYSLEEAEEAVKRPVVQALLKLCRFRNFHPAFKGRVFVDDSTPPHLLRVCWYLGSKHLAILRADFQAQQFSISHTPYKTPSAAEVAAEELEIHSDFSLDLAQVFSIDAMDLVERAEVRKQMAPGAADLGIVDPEQLLTVNTEKRQKHGVGSSNGSETSSNGDQDGCSTGNGSSPCSISEQEEGNGDAGRPAGADSVPRWVAAGGTSGGIGMSSGGAQTGADQDRMTSQQAEWGLLQLDLSFAWKMKDEPVEDVEQLLVKPTVSSTVSR